MQLKIRRITFTNYHKRKFAYLTAAFGGS